MSAIGSRTRVSILLILTFVAGMAAGVAADRQLLADGDAEPSKQAQRDDRKDRHDRRRGTTIERFADELGLTGEQRARIDPILEDAREGMSELFEPVRPAYRELVDSTRARIEEVLTPEQVTEYRRLLEREYGDRDDGRHGDRRDGDRRGDRGRGPDGTNESAPRPDDDEGNQGDTETR